jgi:hypothetical protein
VTKPVFTCPSLHIPKVGLASYSKPPEHALFLNHPNRQPTKRPNDQTNQPTAIQRATSTNQTTQAGATTVASANNSQRTHTAHTSTHNPYLLHPVLIVNQFFGCQFMPQSSLLPNTSEQASIRTFFEHRLLAAVGIRNCCGEA